MKLQNKKAIWQNQEVIIIRELKPNLQNLRMVEIQASPNQKYHIPLKSLKLI